MRRTILCTVVCLTVVALGCSQMVEVKQDFDHYADFESFKTYDWMPVPEDPPDMADVWKHADDVMRKAVDEQLAAKGFSQTSEDPDILVSYTFGVAERRSTQVDFDVDYSRQYTNAEVWKTGGGVLHVDLVNTDTNHLVWRGTANVAINVDPTPEMVEKNINRAMTKLFDQYPPPTLGDR